MLLGYARVSTGDQHLGEQREQLAAVGCERVFSEKRSGAANGSRPELERALDQIREGDVLVVTALDRLARSTRDLLDIAERLRASGAGLRSLHEPWADTTSPAGRMVLTVFAGIAEFERELIAKRTSEGRAAARRRGVRFGRPSALSDEQTEFARRLLEEGKSAAQAAAMLGVHRSTIYRALARQRRADDV